MKRCYNFFKRCHTLSFPHTSFHFTHTFSHYSYTTIHQTLHPYILHLYIHPFDHPITHKTHTHFTTLYITPIHSSSSFSLSKQQKLFISSPLQTLVGQHHLFFLFSLFVFIFISYYLHIPVFTNFNQEKLHHEEDKSIFIQETSC